MHPIFLSRRIVERSNRLEPLAEPQHNGIDEQDDPGYHRHARYRRSGNTHPEDKHEEGIQCNVQHRAAGDSQHPQHGASLRPQVHVHHKGSGHVTPRPYPQDHPDHLDDRHQGKCDPHCPRCAGVDLPHKVGVHHVVESGYQHADDRGDCKPGNQAGNRFGSHPAMPLHRFISIIHISCLCN